MSHIIANTYEILQEIGSGGGGVVYLGRHLRLGKLVVLKADRRTLSAKPEVLRREVDALKNLSHTYIPQVYDFLVEDGVVYTVMDYIEGESLDKPLKRGERFRQATVVKWACQLLEALAYLHARPPHGILHSDIKPANIMVTPQGDICLIDFNIALALGEEGAVRVGFSRGYASPEHYGIDYSKAGATQGVSENVLTQLDDGPATVIPGNSGSSSSGQRTVLLDVRSDIYSAGATLYHLFTGRRPATDAKEVEPMGRDEISPAIAAILRKAMDPDPDLRYQTVSEMLEAFERLHGNDIRTRRHKRRMAAAAICLAVMFLAGGGMTFTGLKQMERTQNALALAEYSDNEWKAGNVPGAVRYALEAMPVERGIFDPPYLPQAQRALSNALGVYDLSDGFKSYRTIPLDSEPLKAVLSPDGTFTAGITSGQVSVFDTKTGTLAAELEADVSALSDLVFADESTVIYAGDGALRCYDLKAGRELWSGEAATGIALSADSSTAAGVYKDSVQAVVYDAATGRVKTTVDFHGKCQSVTVNDIFADPENNLFALNGDGTWLAVSFADGGLRLFDLENPDNDVEIYDISEYTRFEGGFFGQYFAFSALGGGESVFAVIDLESMSQTGGFAGQTPFHVQADESGIYLSNDNILVKLDPVTGAQTEKAYTDADITGFVCGGDGTMVSTDDGAFSFFNGQAVLMKKYEESERSDFVQMSGGYAVSACRDVPYLRVLKLEINPAEFTYDPDYIHDEARFSGDGETVMLFRYDTFLLYSRSGEILADVVIPDAEQVYDQQYRRDEAGSRLEVTYNSGLIRAYSAGNGSLLWEKQGPVPDGTLYEEFLTDRLKITSPLHGTPAAYDRETGELIRELEPNAYLTYVTQVGSYVVTEYISAQGERYGLLLDENCETLAELPELCDILPDGTLVFDDMMGTLRTSRIYSLQELLTLAETNMKEENL